MLGPLISVLCVLAVFPATCEIPPVLPPPLTHPLNSSVLREPQLHISTPGPPDDEEWVPVMVPCPRYVHRRPYAVLAQVLGLWKGTGVVWYILYMAIAIHWGGQHENEQAETGGLNNRGNLMNEQASDIKSNNKNARKSKNRSNKKNARKSKNRNVPMQSG